ncbi:nickel-responsive transcriptional regulator NikR [Paenibacillus hamazuiensis]|uniref:nickel-responsive transcriptional regulator NikR n=1 Tax=Paenibacillus hamazuiensis TaxID=2936508 RepID=UPI00200C0194|nr:nickel-responsive transcriptional regulator NikR [Paenibacillus hamazuiensis]
MADKEQLVRFGVSMPQSLIDQFDEMIGQQGYDNRSEAVRDLIRKALLAPGRIEESRQVAGTIVLVYDHHISELPMTLTELQHRFHHEINSTLHIHLNHHQCLEVIVVRGVYRRLRELQQQMQVLKGVFYAELSVTHVDEHHGGQEPHGHEDHHHG